MHGRSLLTNGASVCPSVPCLCCVLSLLSVASLPSRGSRVAATPLQGVSSASMKRTAHSSTGRRAAPVRAVGPSRPAASLEWTFDSGSDGQLHDSGNSQRRDHPAAPDTGNGRRALRSSSLPPERGANGKARQPSQEQAFSDDSRDNLSTYEAMDTSDLLQLLLTRTIETGKSKDSVPWHYGCTFGQCRLSKHPCLWAEARQLVFR